MDSNGPQRTQWPPTPVWATLAVVACGVATACGDSSSAPEPVPASVSVSPNQATFSAIDETVQFSAQVRDQNGAVMTGVSVSWASSDAGVVSVDASTGLATAVAAGDAVVTARAGPARGNARAAVRQQARAMEKAEGDGQQGFAGEALPVPIAVLVSDANGHPASNITVTFRVASGGGSVSPALARTAADGIARATWTLGIDSAQSALASASDLTATFRATAAPERLAVVTDSLRAGRLTLAYGDTLAARGGSQEGYVWSLAEESSLPAGLALDPEGAIHGTPTETGLSEFDVQVVDSDGGTAVQGLRLRVCDGPLGLETGEVRVMTAPETQPCGFFVRAPQAGAYYRVVIVGTSGSAERILPVELSVEGVAAAESDRRPEPERQAAGQRPGATKRLDWPRAGGPRNSLDVMLANDRLNRRIRQQEAELFGRWAAEGRLAGILERGPGVRSRTEAAAPAVQPQTSPSRRTFRVARRDVANPWNRCEVDLTVNAKLLAEDEHLAVYEDVATTSPVSLENVRKVIDYYADHGAEVIDSYFGGVSDVNGDGRIVVLIDPLLAGVQGYVTSNDMLVSVAQCAVSNEMEIVYLSAAAFDVLDEDRNWVLGGMVHEAAHVSSLYKRVRGWHHRGQSGDMFHPVWIEEGRADIAAEMSSRLAWERAGGPSATARLTGEMFWDGRETRRAEFYGVWDRMARTVLAFSVDPNAVTFEPFDLGTVYGSGWHFHRFLRDWFGGASSSLADDAAFVAALNDSTARTGIAGLTDHIGESFADMLTSHAVAVAVAGAEASLASDETPRFTSFDFPTAAETYYSNPDPPGRYPWPVTLTGADDASAVTAATLARTSTYRGEIGESGFRIHDFRAQTTGDGGVFQVELPLWARVIVARIPEPEPPPP